MSRSSGLNILKRSILTVKLKAPVGIALTDEESAHVIKGWEKERGLVAKRQASLVDVSEDIEDRMGDLPREISKAIADLREAKGNYKKAKHPLTKRKWAKRLILLNAYHTYLRNSHQTLGATVERIKDSIADAQVVHNMIEARVKDAQIYRDLNGGLRLAGKSLVEARTQHALPDVEYQNLEFTMEQIEKELGGPADKLLLEADNVVAGLTEERKKRVNKS